MTGDNSTATLHAPQGAVYSAARVLDQCLDHISGIPGVAPEPISEWRAKLSGQTLNLVVLGQFKRGKTSVINALIGTELLPVGVIPLTSATTILSYGDRINIQVIYDDGRREAIEPASLADYVTEKGNPRNSRGVREVSIEHPSPWLQGGLRLVDTPGIGSVHRHNTDATYGFLPKADAVLLVLSVDQPISQEECDFLKTIREYASKIFVLVNKIDVLTAAELDESMAFIRRTITDAIGTDPNLFPISARHALRERRDGVVQGARNSGFPALCQALDSFLGQGKQDVLAASVARGLARMLSHIQARTEIELKSLDTPLTELQQKIQAFEAKKKAIIQDRDDYVLLLGGESRRLIGRVIDDAGGAFQNDLIRQIDADVARLYRDNRRLPARALYETLQQHVVTEIRRAYDARVRQTEEAVAEAFKTQCARFSTRLNALGDELFRFSSDLFSVRFDAVQAESSWNLESRFSYKFWHESAGLTILISSFMLNLPTGISGPWILNTIKRFLREHVESHEGGMRYDLTQRLDKSLHDFLTVLRDRFDATIAAVEQAVNKGRGLRQAGERQISDTRRDILQRLDVLNDIRGTLEEVLQSLGVGL